MMVTKQTRLRNLKQEQAEAEVDSVLPELLIRRMRESLVGLGVPLYRAAHDGFQWGTGLGLSGTSGTVSDRRAGRNIPIYWSEVDLAGYRTLSRYLCDTNGFAIGFLGRLTDYHIRKGYGWQACLRGEKKGAYATVAGKPTDPLLQKAQQVLDTWRDANQWPMRSREAFRRWRRDGEVFGRFFHGGWDRLPAFRFVGPEQIGSPDGDTNTHKSYGIHSDPHDIETRYEYFIRDPNGTGGPDGEWVSADRIIHAKCNVDSEIKRGIPDFFPLAEQLDGVRDLMRNMIVTAARQAAVAWREKFPAQTMQSVMSMPLGYQNTGQTTTARTAAQSALDMLPIWLGNAVGYGVNRFPPGSVVKVEGDREYEPGPTFQGVPNFVQVEQAVLRGCGARWGMPEYFSGDASNNNFASSLVSGSPFANAVEGTQLEWGCIWEKPIALAVLRFAAESGFFTEQEYRRLDVEVVEPAVISPQPDKDTAMFSVWAQNKWASKDTIRMKLGLDPQHEAEGVRNDEEEEQRQQQPPPPPPGGDSGGGSPASPFPPAPGGGSVFGESTGDNQRQDGEVWQGDSGKWFTKIDGHVQPTKAPGGDETAQGKQQNSSGQQKKARKSKAKVTLFPSTVRTSEQVQRDVEEGAKAALGKYDPEQIASLVGSPDDAEVIINSLSSNGKNVPGVSVTTKHKEFTSKRRIMLIDNILTIKNEEFWVNPESQGKGVGADVFAMQVENAVEAGVGRIVCHAAKENPQEPDNPHNGYYTWPRFGYDMRLDDETGIAEEDLPVFEACRERFPEADTILDVMSTQEGRDWWKANGTDLLNAQFDLSPNSRSLKIFQAYLQEKAAKKGAKPKQESKASTYRQSKNRLSNPLGRKSVNESEDRPDNVPWQGESGKWFVKRNGRTVPTKAPGSQQPAASQQGQQQPADSGHGEGRDVTGAPTNAQPGKRFRAIDRTTTHEGVKAELAKSLTPEQAKEAIRYHDGMTQVGSNAPNKRLPDATRPQFDDLERGALQKYSYKNDRVLNGALRGNADAVQGSPYNEAFYAEMHTAMQSAFEKTPVLSKPVTVVRGMNLDEDRLAKFLETLNSGEVQFDGYTSTAAPGGLLYSMGLAGATDSIPAAFRGNVRLEISAIHGIDMSPHSQLPGENEFLINHASKFKVKSVVNKNGVYTIKLDQLAPVNTKKSESESVRESDDTTGNSELLAWYAEHPELADKWLDSDAAHVKVADGTKTESTGDNPRQDNVPWQGESGKWFVKKNGRTVPAKAPGSDKGGGSKLPKRGGVEIAPESERGHNAPLPKDPKRLNIDQANAALAQMGYKKVSSRSDLKTKTSYVTLRFPNGEEKEVTADDVKRLLYGRAPKQADTQQPATTQPANDSIPTYYKILMTDPANDSKHLQKLADAMPEGDAKEYLLNAAWNTQTRNTGNLSDYDAKLIRIKTLGEIGKQIHDAIDVGDKESAAQLAEVATSLGAQLSDNIGQTIDFDGSLYSSSDSVFTGHKVKVIAPAIVWPGIGIARKGVVKKV